MFYILSLCDIQLAPFCLQNKISSYYSSSNSPMPMGISSTLMSHKSINFADQISTIFFQIFPICINLGNLRLPEARNLDALSQGLPSSLILLANYQLIPANPLDLIFCLSHVYSLFFNPWPMTYYVLQITHLHVLPQQVSLPVVLPSLYSHSSATSLQIGCWCGNRFILIEIHHSSSATSCTDSCSIPSYYSIQSQTILHQEEHTVPWLHKPCFSLSPHLLLPKISIIPCAILPRKPQPPPSGVFLI